MLTCVFSRSVWTQIGLLLGRSDWGSVAEDSLVDWCIAMVDPRYTTRDIRTFLCLVMWEVWKHRNAIVFDGASPSVRNLIRKIATEGLAWRQAGLLKGSWEAHLEVLRTWANGE